MQKKYSIGEAAKLLQVSTRTLRFYDEKDLVKPAYTENNGYRFYKEDQIKQLEVIIYLKGLGFSLRQIKKLLQDKNVDQSLKLLLDQQYQENKQKIAELNKKQNEIKHLQKIKISHTFIANFSDITDIMRRENKLTALRQKTLIFGFLLTLIEIAGIGMAFYLHHLNMITALVWEIIILVVIVFVVALRLSKYYYDQVEYICPNCGNVIIPSFLTFNLSAHTPKFRKLTCPKCGKKSYCLEVSRY